MPKAKSAIEFLTRYAYAWWRTSLLFAFGPFSRAGRYRIQNLSWHLGYGEGAPKLQKIDLEKIVGSGVSITVCEPKQGEWEATAYEVAAINAIVAKFSPRKVFEIGTFDGRSTLNIAANVPLGAVVYTLDLPPGTYELPNGVVAGGKFKEHPLRERITQLYGDSATFDYAPYNGQIDLVFVDAGHSYEHAAGDTKKALEMVKGRSGAIILWHDYGTWAGVSQAVDELIPQVKNAKLFGQIAGTSLACLILP